MDYADLVDEDLKKKIQKKARSDAEVGNYSLPQNDSVCGSYFEQLVSGAQNCVYADAFHTRKLRLERK